MGSPLIVPEFVKAVEMLDQDLSLLNEDAVINLLLNLLKRAVDRHGTYPLYVVDAVIDILDARIFFDPTLAGSKRADN